MLVVFGTRPEAIKLAPVIKALEGVYPAKVCVSGQHRDMLSQTLNSLGVVPHINLDVMEPGQGLNELAENFIAAFSPVLQELQPRLILVQGDTTTAFIAGLAAYYEGVEVAHVEAGLRTGDIRSPWPEEGNRKLLTAITNLHFAPTTTAARNLLKEGVERDDIVVTGNTVIDTLLQTKAELLSSPDEQNHYREVFAHFIDRDIVLITGHRRESFGEGFRQICRAINELARQFETCNFVYPVHMNPQVKHVVESELSDKRNVFLIEPQSYRSFVYLMMQSKIILTDSGGIQEEAPSLGKPVVVMRDKTERPEAVTAGTVVLAGADETRIVREVEKLLTDDAWFQKMSQELNPYGDGTAAQKIVETLMKRFSDGR